jgi:DNA polymerase-3 subunit delta'
VLGKDPSSQTIGCYREGAVRLSGYVTPSQAARIHSCIEKAWGAVESNVSIPLVLTALCAEIMDIAG